MPLTRFPDGVDIGDSAGVAGTLAIGGTAITATSAELNLLSGVAAVNGTVYNAGTAVTATAAEMDLLVGQTTKFRAGTLAGTFGAATSIATGLASAAGATANLRAIGTGSALLAVVPGGAGGTITVQAYGVAGGTATTLGTISWMAFGT